ncbi:uncharacterized protein DS421_9g268670 [Arachis hypogaea]|uniref:Uncharacterized protein n=1 Tax=Arachis hypogaea TaxID=3818 RepID=A0A445BJW5_ARAHY|nr:uncharacterized protein DS421_9g268670 [Arachis hypogaea]RYR38962.1 hypothetical protein Ahy_A09g044327 isoform C [Arachis hypogaea]
MMPTPGVPRSCTQQANEPSNTASHGVQSDLAIVAPSQAGSCGERHTTYNSTQNAQGQGTSTTTGHSSTSAPKLRYDGAKWFLTPTLAWIEAYFSGFEGKLQQALAEF